jgi:hypothetical protein
VGDCLQWGHVACSCLMSKVGEHALFTLSAVLLVIKAVYVAGLVGVVRVLGDVDVGHGLSGGDGCVVCLITHLPVECSPMVGVCGLFWHPFALAIG